MRLTSYGAAREVTGSKHLLELNGSRVLLDCGLFQGRRKESAAKNRELPFKASSLNAMILSHAHIDHSGLIPLLGKNGYSGRIYCTPATRDLCSIMLMDSAHIQERDAEFLARKKRSYVPPLYERRDVHRIMRRFVCVPYEEPFEVVPGLTATFYDAGHVLGSAITLFNYTDNGQEKSFLFSGDLGRTNLPLLEDPWEPPATDAILMESTYGNREHEPFVDMEQELADVVNRTRARGGKVIVPSFALERAQEVVYTLKVLEMDGAIEPVPVYVDSPLTVNLTEVFRLHTDSFDDEASAVMEEAGDPFRLTNIAYIRDVQDSIQLNSLKGPAIIISAAGMCEQGRILHHLKNHCEDSRNTILIVGFQAEHTLGRRIVERQPRIRILGDEYDLNAEVEVLDAFSCHAGRSELIAFGTRVKDTGTVYLVHGEHESMAALKAGLESAGVSRVDMPERGKAIEV